MPRFGASFFFVFFADTARVQPIDHIRSLLAMSQENAPIWRKPMSLEGLNASSRNTLMAHLGILYTAFGPDWLEASMPVDHRTHQPLGMLHGGASVVLAETLGCLLGVAVAAMGMRHWLEALDHWHGQRQHLTGAVLPWLRPSM